MHGQQNKKHTSRCQHNKPPTCTSSGSCHTKHTAHYTASLRLQHTTFLPVHMHTLVLSSHRTVLLHRHGLYNTDARCAVHARHTPPGLFLSASCRNVSSYWRCERIRDRESVFETRVAQPGLSMVSPVEVTYSDRGSVGHWCPLVASNMTLGRVYESQPFKVSHVER